MRLGDINMAGPGDPETWGPVFHPMDPRQPDPTFAEDAIQAAADALFDKYLASSDWVSEAQSCLETKDYAAITLAYVERDAMKLFQVTDAAIQRVLKRWALDTAREDFERIGE
ncbi:hypothetical protein J5J83_19870 [Azoarcus sp. L1K30]|uniref:hypothetical protein n=1 Tax=Azoarcus sp. L1K30 TaxID=2820277 RepID=UPI001B840BBE|nr:hypothetical protein [Azoarcus sp. L1K30]MBR0568386.1 hypothetical protein [Azoarcus sp. L1K30]